MLAPDQLLEALVEGLAGMQVGGRRAVTIPYADLDEAVVDDLGLPANTDLVVIARPLRRALTVAITMSRGWRDVSLTWPRSS